MSNTPSPIQEAIKVTRGGEMARGLKMLGDYLQKNPGDAEALGHQAWWLISNGDYLAASDSLGRLIQIHAADGNAHALLGDCHLRLGDKAAATNQYAEAIRLNPMNKRAIAGLSVLSDKDERSSAEALEHSPANQALYVNSVISKLEQSPGTTFPRSCSPEVGRLLYLLVRTLRPNAALETGTNIAYSTICIAQALEDNGLGKVHSIDLHVEGEYSSPLMTGIQMDLLAVARTHVEAAGLSNRVEFHKGDSASIAKRLMDDNLDPDFVFIDGDHSINGCWRDFDAIQGKLRMGAVVVFHDTDARNSGFDGPYTLLSHLRGEQYEKSYQVLNLPTPKREGLGIVQKVGDALPLGHAKWYERFLGRSFSVK